MRISIDVSRQLHERAGSIPQILELPEGSTVADALGQLAQAGKSDLRPLLLNTNGTFSPTVLICVNDQQVISNHHALQNGDRLSLLMPISGG